MKGQNVLFSHSSDEWETPPGIFNKISETFKFDIDVCATAENKKADNFYCRDDDGLSISWPQNSLCWMNPPYSQIKHWVAKAQLESMNGTTTVALLPSRTDTIYFHKHIYGQKNVDVHFLKGRLKFQGASHSAPFPSMVCIFWGKNKPYKPAIDFSC